MTSDIIWASSSGIAFAVTMLVLAVFFPTPSNFQVSIFRSAMALAAGSMAAAIPGFLQVETTGTGFAIRAGGALAVFLLVYKFNPARLFGDNVIGDNQFRIIADNLKVSNRAAAKISERLAEGRPTLNMIDFINNENEIHQLKRVIQNIASLRFRNESLPNQIRTYVSSKTSANWDNVKESVSNLIELLENLKDTLATFDGDFLAYRLEEYQKLMTTVAARSGMLRGMEVYINPPRSKKDIDNLLRIAAEYDKLVDKLHESGEAIAAYIKQQRGDVKGQV